MALFDRVLASLELEIKGDQQFIGQQVDIGSPNIYGGHVMAQALRAARICADANKKVHSLHGYFLHPGSHAESVEFKVEVIKQGRSFDVLKVEATQRSRTIFIMSASFHLPEKGIEHQAAMPNIVAPSQLQPFSKIFADFAEKFGIQARGILSSDGPFVFHPLEYYDPFNPGIRAPRQHLWFKPNGTVPGHPDLHAELMAYISDFNLLITSLLPHNLSFFTTPLKIASLDHAMWFHEDFEMNDWMLYEVESPRAAGGRAFCTGRIYSSSGILLASVTQEGLVRKM
jgi:acyl-CoA thioesterase-2